MKRFLIGFVFCFAVFAFGTFLAFRLQDATRPSRTAGFPRPFWVQTAKQSRFHHGALAIDLAIVLYCSWKFGRYFQRRGIAEPAEPEDEGSPQPPATNVQAV